MPDKKALLIGVPEHTPKSNIPSFPKVVINDLEALKSVLESNKYKVEVLGIEKKGIYPTKNHILNEIKSFILDANEGDILLIYFSGHGLHFQGSDYIIPYDAVIKNPEHFSFDEFLIKIDFSKTISDSNAEFIVFFIDACREGVNVLRDKGALPFGFSAKSVEFKGWSDSEKEKVLNKKFAFIYSCQIGEVAHYKNDEESFSYFGKALANSFDHWVKL